MEARSLLGFVLLIAVIGATGALSQAISSTSIANDRVETMTAGEVEMWVSRLGVSVDGRRLVAGLSGADLLALADDLDRISAGLRAVRDRRAHAERHGGAVSHGDLLDGTKVHTWADHLSDPGLPVEEAPADNGTVDVTLPGALAVADWKVADVVRWARGLGFSDVFEKLLITELVVNEVSGADLPDLITDSDDGNVEAAKFNQHLQHLLGVGGLGSPSGGDGVAADRGGGSAEAEAEDSQAAFPIFIRSWTTDHTVMWAKGLGLPAAAERSLVTTFEKNDVFGSRLEVLDVSMMAGDQAVVDGWAAAMAALAMTRSGYLFVAPLALPATRDNNRLILARAEYIKQVNRVFRLRTVSAVVAVENDHDGGDSLGFAASAITTPPNKDLFRTAASLGPADDVGGLPAVAQLAAVMSGRGSRCGAMGPVSEAVDHPVLRYALGPHLHSAALVYTADGQSVDFVVLCQGARAAVEASVDPALLAPVSLVSVDALVTALEPHTGVVVTIDTSA